MVKPTLVASLVFLSWFQTSFCQLDDNLVREMVQEAEDDLQQLRMVEEELFRFQEQNNLHGHSRRPSPSATRKAEVSLVLEGTTQKLVDYLEGKGGPRRGSSAGVRQVTEELPVSHLSQVAARRVRRSGSSSHIKPSCELESEGECDPSARYRTFSGRCNNLANPEFGTSNSVLERILPSEYDDIVSAPRSRGTAGSPLPNPRTISLLIHFKGIVPPDPQQSLSTMQWGQIVDHDLTHVPATPGHDLSQLQCKSCLSPLQHPACLPILIPSSETFFEKFGQGQPLTCIPFTRSLSGQHTLGPRQHINQVTHYLDGSMVYGDNACKATELRDPDNSALLRSSKHPLTAAHRPLKPMLPFNRIDPDCLAKDGDCFLAGDSRVNEQPGLTSLHTMFMREHNQLVGRLININPHWGAERLFQEARRIVVAVIQHITFNEFVPKVLGSAFLEKFMLDLVPSGYYYGYSSSCSGSIFSEFATAAFRFGHSMIRPNLTMMTNKDMEEGTGGQQVSLRSVFKNPDMIKFNAVIDDLVRGLVMAPMESVDNHMTDEVTNHLFEKENKKFSGMDLAAINIQRGRDHGIPGYNKYRQVCGLRKAANFVDLQNEVPEILVGKLAALYNHPDDIDLFTGLMAEKRLSEGLVGPTLGCLLALQFQHLRACDRHWFETGDPLLRFSPDQLTELRSQSLASVLCRNCDSASKMPPWSMNQPGRSEDNQLVSCDKLGALDLELWRE